MAGEEHDLVEIGVEGGFWGKADPESEVRSVTSKNRCEWFMRASID